MVKAELPIDAHTSRPWRIHVIAGDFRVLDVWALPTPGGPDDFGRLITAFGTFDPARSSPVVRALFAARWTLGRLLKLDDETGCRTAGLRDGLPADLRDTFPSGVATGPFTPLYATADEAAMEIVNRTVHGILHLGWVPDGSGGFRGQMAVLVKPNGLLGSAYLAAIAPFRHLAVYPIMLGELERLWRDGTRVPGEVTQVDVPEDVRALSTLPRVDYADSFLADARAHPEWNAERWARAVLEEAPPAMRARLLAGWSALGLKGAAPTDRSVLGWKIRRTSDGRSAARQGIANRHARRTAVRATPRRTALRDVRASPHSCDPRHVGSGRTRPRAHRARTPRAGLPRHRVGRRHGVGGSGLTTGGGGSSGSAGAAGGAGGANESAPEVGTFGPGA